MECLNRIKQGFHAVGLERYHTPINVRVEVSYHLIEPAQAFRSQERQHRIGNSNSDIGSPDRRDAPLPVLDSSRVVTGGTSYGSTQESAFKAGTSIRGKPTKAFAGTGKPLFLRCAGFPGKKQTLMSLSSRTAALHFWHLKNR
jgi:hypothetical protein